LPRVIKLFITVLFLIGLVIGVEAEASETGAVYRAKRGTDIYFKSIKYKKTVLLSYVELWAEHFDLPPNLIKGQIEQESGWDNNIVSFKGARGLMQIMPETAYCKKRLCLKLNENESLHNPYTNVYYGCKYMSMMLKTFDGNYRHALMAYYGGPGRLRKILNGKVKSKRLIAEIEGYSDDVYEKALKYLELNQFTQELIDGVEPVIVK